MKKKILIISLIVIALISCILYYTYAIDITIEKTSSTDSDLAYNRARLGDATGEVMLTASSTGAWNGDYAYFVYSSRPWFQRGGICLNGSDAGVFGFSDYNGSAYSGTSARAALLAL